MNNVRNYIWYLETENPLVNFREVQTVVEGRAGAGAWISAACLCLIGFQQHTLKNINVLQNTFFFSTVTVYFVRSIFWFLGAGSSIDFSSPLILSPLQSTMDLFVDTKSRYSNFSIASCAVGWVTATKLSSSSHHPHHNCDKNLNILIFQGLAVLLGSFLHRWLQELFSLLPPVRTTDGGEVHHQRRNIISPKRKIGSMPHSKNCS